MLVNKVGWFCSSYIFDFSDNNELDSFICYLENSGWILVKSEEDNSSESSDYHYVYNKVSFSIEITLDKLGIYRVIVNKSSLPELISHILESIEELKIKIPLFAHKKTLKFLEKHKKNK